MFICLAGKPAFGPSTGIDTPYSDVQGAKRSKY